jgi:tripartite-type tricarboxylate transporter receptor subunit TctC
MGKFLICLLMLTSFVHASELPITVVVPFAPGGSTDMVARIVQQGLSREMNRPVNLLYKPGAGGTIALTHVREQKNQGTTLMIHSGAFFINAAMDPVVEEMSKDFTLISPLGYHSFVLVSKQNFPHQNVHKWNQLQNVNISIGNAGLNTSSYLINRLLHNQFRNINFNHIPYSKGFAPMVSDLLAGNIDLTLLPVGMAKPLAAAGKLNVLAVVDTQNLDFAPHVPTFKELKIKMPNINSPVFLFGTDSLSQQELLRLRAAAQRTLADPAVTTQFQVNSIKKESLPQNPDLYISDQVHEYKKIIKNAN